MKDSKEIIPFRFQFPNIDIDFVDHCLSFGGCYFLMRFFDYSISNLLLHLIGGHSHLLSHQLPVLTQYALRRLVVIVTPALIINDLLSSELLDYLFVSASSSNRSVLILFKYLVLIEFPFQVKLQDRRCGLSFPRYYFLIILQFKCVKRFVIPFPVQSFVRGFLDVECYLIPYFYENHFNPPISILISADKYSART